MKEGEYGRKIINQYTRYLNVILSIMYSFGYAVYLRSKLSDLALTPGWAFRLLFVLSIDSWMLCLLCGLVNKFRSLALVMVAQ